MTLIPHVLTIVFIIFFFTLLFLSSYPFLDAYPFLVTNLGLLSLATDQQRLPFLQKSAPASAVIEPTKEDGLAPKLDALA